VPEVAAPARSDTAAGRRLLFLLFLVGLFNAADRRILMVLLEPIRLEFGASDTAMGLLTGFAFVLFYSVATLPIARLADARPRRTIILTGLWCWSALTAVSGIVTSFWQLALARVGVGVGEAAYLPAGMSMVSDRFPHERRTLAMAVFSLSFPIGMMLALVVGGRMGAALGWRPTVAWLGGAGLVVALVAGTLLEEPERGRSEKVAADRSLYGVRETLAYLGRLRSFRHLALGAALAMFAATSLGTWGPTFLMRVQGLDVARAGAALGPPTGIGGITGVLVVGGMAQRLARRDARWLLWLPALVQLVACPFILLFLTLTDVRAAMVAFAPVAMAGSAVIPPTMAAVQGLAKVRMRALAAALVSFTVNLAGIGLGPLLAGLASDVLQPRFGAESIRYALVLNAAVVLWAGAHFLLGARSLREELGG
jgi:predicted MFS family arabinose efflux permease